MNCWLSVTHEIYAVTELVTFKVKAELKLFLQSRVSRGTVEEDHATNRLVLQLLLMFVLRYTSSGNPHYLLLAEIIY